jgi:glucose-1-phosphate adenylyltransferase
VSIAVLPVTRDAVGGFGIMRLDDAGRVVEFVEKPKDPAVIDQFRTDASWIDARGVQSRGREYLASMGIYLFKRDVLVKLLTEFNHTDFGRELFPHSIRTHHVQAHLFDGYWEDIGTIKSFWKSNLDLATDSPPFDLAAADARIFSRPRFLPPSRLSGVHVERSLIADGCSIGVGARVENSVIGLRCHIGAGVTIRNSVLMGADYYESGAELAENRRERRPDVGIGDGSIIETAIIDKNCRIGRNCRVVNGRGIENSEATPSAMICDGIIVVPKESTLPDGWSL